MYLISCFPGTLCRCVALSTAVGRDQPTRALCVAARIQCPNGQLLATTQPTTGFGQPLKNLVLRNIFEEFDKTRKCGVAIHSLRVDRSSLIFRHDSKWQQRKANSTST